MNDIVLMEYHMFLSFLTILRKRQTMKYGLRIIAKDQMVQLATLNSNGHLYTRMDN